MHAHSQLLLDFLQLRSHALADRHAPHSKRPVPVLPADMREAKEVEGLRLAFPSSFPVLFGVPPELDPARLVRMQFQSELPQPFTQLLAKTVCVGSPLEPEDDVIRIAEDDHLASRILLAPDVHPEIEHIVEIDVGKERRDYRSLRSTCLRLRPFPFLHHPGLEPFLDQAQGAAVGDAVLNELDHPCLVEVIEEALDVSIKHIVHLLLHERIGQRIQRLMLAAPRTKSIREAEEVLLIDLVEDGDHCLLDDLVLQCGDPERTFPSVAFLDKYPSRWKRTVCSAMQPAVQIDEPILQPGFLFLPCNTVHSGRGFALQRAKTV